MLTYHGVPSEGFDPTAASYLPSAYPEDGFIHTTRLLSHVAEVANRHYRDDPRPYLLLTIELDRIGVPWRYDAAGDDYPHIYGPLDLAAVVDVRTMPRAADGTFLPLAEDGG